MDRARSLQVGVAALAMMPAFVACSSDDPSSAAPAGTNDPSPTASSAASSPTALPTPSGWTPLEGEGGTTLSAGRYGLNANGRPDVPWAVVRVPEGFSPLFDWALFDEQTRGAPGLGYWTVSEVDRDPCAGGESDPMDAGSTVDDLVAALGRQRLTKRTEPTPVTLDGNRGVYLEIEVPDIDVSQCFRQEYSIWESDPEGARHMEEGGTVDHLWIVEVDGAVVVLNLTASPDVPPQAFRRATQVVESVRFVRWPDV